MKNPTQSFFYFTKAEKRGIFLILILSVILLIVPGFIKSINQDAKLKFEEIEHKDAGEVKSKREYVKPKYSFKSSKNVKNLINKLDINSASKDQLLQLGLSKQTSNTIIKYREKGGVFKNLESLKKIYCIKDNEFEALKKGLVFEADTMSKHELIVQAFDPNTATKEELLAMGIRLRLVQTMINFRARGFKFREKEDIAKIYGITEEEINAILPNIRIDKTCTPEPNFKQNKRPYSYKNLVEINTATIEELDGLRGIGTVWANKIKKYRDALGGFYTVDQIKEIRGIDDSLASLVMKQISCNGNVKMLGINKAPYEVLSKHPYISGKQAGVIINYIKQHSKLNSINDLEKIMVFKPEELKKLTPYIELNEVNN